MILKAFVKFARALCPFAGGYYKKQTSVDLDTRIVAKCFSDFNVTQLNHI